MLRNLCIALLFAAAFPAAAADAGWQSGAGLFRVTFQSELDPIVINRIHNWVLHIEDEHGAPVAGATLAVTGGMPAHDHGLPTAPQVTRELAAGDYVLEGLRFHMSGRWELQITITTDDSQDVVVISLDL